MMLVVLLPENAYACMIYTPWQVGIFYPILCFLLGSLLVYYLLKIDHINQGKMWKWVVPTCVVILSFEFLFALLIGRTEVVYSSLCGFSLGFGSFVFLMFSAILAIAVLRKEYEKK